MKRIKTERLGDWAGVDEKTWLDFQVCADGPDYALSLLRHPTTAEGRAAAENLLAAHRKGRSLRICGRLRIDDTGDIEIDRCFGPIKIEGDHVTLDDLKPSAILEAAYDALREFQDEQQPA